MRNTGWQNELYGLLARFSSFGICDLPSMTTDEQWGLYRFLLRMRRRDEQQQETRS